MRAAERRERERGSYRTRRKQSAFTYQYGITYYAHRATRKQIGLAKGREYTFALIADTRTYKSNTRF